MKFCFDLGGKTYCIPVPFRPRWPWEEVIFKDRIRDRKRTVIPPLKGWV